MPVEVSRKTAFASGIERSKLSINNLTSDPGIGDGIENTSCGGTQADDGYEVKDDQTLGNEELLPLVMTSSVGS